MLDVVHLFEHIAYLSRLYGYHSMLVISERITEQIDGYSGHTCLAIDYVDRTVVRLDWFHYGVLCEYQ